LNRRNLFVTPLDSQHYWFRYHHLFAELLNGHLQRLRASDLPTLHRRAAQWHAANSDAGEALRHALLIPDYTYASRMVVDNWRRIYHQGHLRMAVEWLKALPADFIRQSPPLGVAYCWTLFVRGDVDRIPPFLDEATAAFEQMVASGALPRTHPEYNIVMQQIGLLRAVVARHHGDLATAIKEVEQILPTVAGFRQTLGQVVVDMGFTACYSQMGYNYLATGDWDRAADYLTRVSPHARACGNIFALAHTTFELARLRLRQGRLSEAEAICLQELMLAEQPAYADWPAFCLIHLALADVLRAQKRWDEAAAYLQRGLETAQRSGHVLYLAQGHLSAARLHHARGDGAGAQADCHRAEQLAATINQPALNQAITHVKQEIAFASSGRAPSAQSLIEPLSERELQVLRLICEGKSNQEIADELVIALDTVKRHANNLYGKLGVKRRAQAIIEARKLRLV
jgi:LuxR family maltose regulon positive regulatory protein